MSEESLDILLPNATEFQRIAIMDAHRRAGDLSKEMPAPGSPEEKTLMEMGAMALEALGWGQSDSNTDSEPS